MLSSAYTAKLVEAGLDEAGRGCLAGPVVAAAVILPKDYKHNLLTDSKQLTASQRELLKEEIKKEAICYAIAEVCNVVIDEINILKASFLAMHKAVEQLMIIPELLLVDGNRFSPYPFVSHVCIVKGDAKFLSIAAASVLAKTHRDELMSNHAKNYPQYGWETNFAYATLFHRKAILKHGHTPLHRLTFNVSLFNENADETIVEN